MLDLTEGTLLGGQLRYRQPAAGYRTGIEPVLLAASVAARPGERVIEAGTGAGAALLCLRARLAGVACHGIERDAALAAIAAANLCDNGFADTAVEVGDVTTLAAVPRCDHAIANPPWHDPGSTASPDALRDAAKRGVPNLLVTWARSLAGWLDHGGSLTMLVPVGSLPSALSAMAAAGCGSPAVMPLWPRAGQAARLMLLRTTKGGQGNCRLLPGLVLHDGDAYSTAARAILWGGSALGWQ